MAQRFNVELAADQFEELCRPSQPMAAVAELIWNGLDAEAATVDVVINRNDFHGLDRVQVIDSGHGMSNADALRDFRTLGGSWKRDRTHSKNGLRTLHGKRGQGRFRAFAIGTNAIWYTVGEGLQGLERTVIEGSLRTSEFSVTDPEPLAKGAPGTTVTISGPRETASPLLGETASNWLITRLAVYLAKYPQVTVTYDGNVLDPSSVLERDVTITLPGELGGTHGVVQLRVMEWKRDIVGFQPLLILCDAEGVPLHEISDELPVGPFKLTGYLTWAGFAEYANDLLLEEMDHPILSPIVSAGRKALTQYVEDRAIEERQSIIDEWKSRNVYPYATDATTPTEAVERQVFDVVAVTAAGSVSSEPRAARLSLRLLKEALEQSPDSLHRVLQEVLDLTAEQVRDFDHLLRTTRLSAIIAATAKVVDRLTFLDDLHRLLFDDDSKEAVRERGQLHEMLANGRTWIFGEEYDLVVADKTLTKVLEAHLNLLGNDRPVMGPVADASGNTRRRVDLMLSRSAQGPSGRRHLVVELKRPSIVLGQAELGQITNYAIAVAEDPSFKTPDVTWDVFG